MNAHTAFALARNPLSATVDAIEAATGLFAATVETGYGLTVVPGYFSRAEALQAGERTAIDRYGRVPLMPSDYAGASRGASASLPAIRDACSDLAETLATIRTATRGDNRRRERATVRAAKRAFLDSI